MSDPDNPADQRAHFAEAFQVPRETMALLDSYVEFLVTEAGAQNLIAASTIPHIWQRHLHDSAQLISLAPEGDWIDLGSGAGFPGLVVAALTDRHVTLVEQRPKRAAFLEAAADLLGVRGRVTVHAASAKAVPAQSFAVITARAFAPLDRLFALGARFTVPTTCWILPKGKNANMELAAARASWQGRFKLVASVTDPNAAIIVADQIQRRSRV